MGFPLCFVLNLKGTLYRLFLSKANIFIGDLTFNIWLPIAVHFDSLLDD